MKLKKSPSSKLLDNSTDIILKNKVLIDEFVTPYLKRLPGPTEFIKTLVQGANVNECISRAKKYISELSDPDLADSSKRAKYVLLEMSLVDCYNHLLYIHSYTEDAAAQKIKDMISSKIK